jgi:hypothetical protein
VSTPVDDRRDVLAVRTACGAQLAHVVDDHALPDPDADVQIGKRQVAPGVLGAEPVQPAGVLARDAGRPAGGVQQGIEQVQVRIRLGAVSRRMDGA